MSVPEITELPTPPSRVNDPENFNTAADAFMDALPTMVTELNGFAPALVAAAAAANYSATSATSITIGTGEKVFTIETGKMFAAGQTVVIASLAAPTVDFMAGIVTDYTTDTLTVEVAVTGGSGAHTDWSIGLSGQVGPTGATGATGPAGTGSVDSVNGDSGPAITLTQDNIGDGSTYKQYSGTEKTKLSGIATGAQVNLTAAATATAIDGSTAAEETLAGALTGNATALATLRDAIKPTEAIIIACSDETTPLTTGTNKVRFRAPYAFTLTGIRASLTTAQSSGSTLIVDVNENGSTIMSAVKLRFDNGERTTVTYSGTAAALSDTSLADDAQITIDIDQVGDGTATGLKVTLIGRRT